MSKNSKSALVVLVVIAGLAVAGYFTWRNMANSPLVQGSTSLNEDPSSSQVAGLANSASSTPQSAQQQPSQEDILAQIAKVKDQIAQRTQNTQEDIDFRYQSDLVLGISYAKIDQYQNAVDAFQAAAREKPDQFVPWSNLGTLYVQLDEPQKAKNALETALALDPTQVNSWQKYIDLNTLVLKSDKSTVDKIYQQALSATNNSQVLKEEYDQFLSQ